MSLIASGRVPTTIRTLTFGEGATGPDAGSTGCGGCEDITIRVGTPG